MSELSLRTYISGFPYKYHRNKYHQFLTFVGLTGNFFLPTYLVHIPILNVLPRDMLLPFLSRW